MVKLLAFHSKYLHSQNHFEDDGTQNYFVSQPDYRYY